MKIAVIGGGGVRSMFLAKSLAQGSEELGFDEIVFMDNDEKKLNIYGRMSAQLVKTLHPGLDFKLTTDPVEAVKDADYIITTIRVGGDDMRIRDEKAALAKHLLGQETTGAAGFSFAMRSVPALAEYCELAKKYASPDVKIFNFTNPAGVVSQTLRDMGMTSLTVSATHPAACCTPLPNCTAWSRTRSPATATASTTCRSLKASS